jgi:hypothetical protein
MNTEYDQGASSGSQVRQGLDKAREKTAEVAREAKQRGKQRIERGKDAAADQVQQVARAVDEVASRLGAEQSSLAGVAGDIAQRMTSLAESLRNRSVDDLAYEAQQLARRNPTTFFIGSIALGAVLARMLKAASAVRERPGSQQFAGQQYGNQPYGGQQYGSQQFGTQQYGDQQYAGSGFNPGTPGSGPDTTGV